MDQRWVLMLGVLVLAFAFPRVGSAQPLTIHVCGHSTHTCAQDITPNPGAAGTESGLPAPGVTTNANTVCNSAGKCVNVPTATGNAGRTPSGWSSPTGPPSTAPTQVTYNRDGVIRDSMVQACIDSPPNADYEYTHVDAAPTFTCWYREKLNHASTTWRTGSTVTGCPSGYTLSGGVCNLSNASNVVKPSDGTCDIKRVGNSFSGDTQDPDCYATAGTAKTELQVTASGQTVSAAAPGVSVGTTVDAGTGAGTITYSRANADGTTTTTTIVIGAPGSGQAPADGGNGTIVQGTSSATYQGTGTLQSGTADAPKPKDPCGLPGTAPCKIDETGTPTDGALQAQKDAYDTATLARKTELEALTSSRKVTSLGLSLDVAWPSGGCVNPTFGIDRFGLGEVELCEHAVELQSIVSWMVGLMTAFSLFGIGVGALRGA